MAKKQSYQQHRQQRAIAALMSNGSIKSAAKSARIGYRTLCRWMDDDENFRAQLVAAETAAVSSASRRISAASAIAVDTLVAVMQNQDADDKTRIQAASTVLQNLPRTRLLGSLERTILELQASVK